MVLLEDEVFELFDSHAYLPAPLSPFASDADDNEDDDTALAVEAGASTDGATDKVASLV